MSLDVRYFLHRNCSFHRGKQDIDFENNQNTFNDFVDFIEEIVNEDFIEEYRKRMISTMSWAKLI